jgi:Pectate lyase superfamily protein
MPKSIPTSGTLNWSIPLNDHISQLQDPTNGAINSFSQFSGRPTNLTSNDIGKTYLYTQTGNMHQWTGTTWKVLNESVVNVKDYGAVGDGVVDDTASVQAIMDVNSSINPFNPTGGNGKTIFFPEGIFLVNIKTTYNTGFIKGSGNNSTFLKSFTPTGCAIQIGGHNDAWNKFHIEDICFFGNDTLTQTGIRYSDDTITTINPSAPQVWMGGLVVKHCTFKNLNKAIFKPFGNLNNHITDCSFYKCNYHLFNQGVFLSGSPYTIYAADDQIDNCHFQLAQKASIYYNDNGANSGGNYVLKNCTFENNYGITLYVKAMGPYGSFCGGFLLEHCWIEEAVPVTTQINIDGVNYSKTVLVAIDSNINFQNCNTVNCKLVRANIFYNNCSDAVTLGPLEVVKDANSSLIVSNLRHTNDNSSGFFTRDFIYEQNLTAVNYTVSMKTKPRWIVSHNIDNVLASESFANKNLYTLTNGSGVSVRDGVLFDRCIELQNITFVTFENLLSIAISPNKYILWTFDAKLVTGTSVKIDIGNSGGNIFSNAVDVISTKWTSYLGMGYAKTASLTTSLRAYASTASTVRISAFQCLAFDTLQEMMEYAESGHFRSKAGISTSFSDVSPTTGTYNKGDIIYNTNPASAGYVGWVCTVGGNPGTWKGFGLIQ